MKLEEEKEFIETLQNEIDEFKAEMLKKSNIQIYDEHYKIHSMEELAEYLIDTAEIYDRKGFPKTNILEYLYDEFLGTNYDLTREDLSCFIADENKLYKINHDDRPLAERIDEFYSQYDPYERYDATGSFDSKYDSENIGLEQIKECLSTQNGCEHIAELLDKVIKYDEDIDMVSKAISLKNALEKEITKFQNDIEM